MDDMSKLLFAAAAVLLIGGVANTASAQNPKSPHDTVTADVGGHKITVTYGRPSIRGRKIMGGLVPYGQVWRTGADEATTFETDANLDINGLKVPAGKYSLFTLPTEGGWTLILNKTAKQWGAFNYKEGNDLGRTKMNVTKAGAPVEQFTITITPSGSNAATLKLEWENTVASVPIKVE